MIRNYLRVAFRNFVRNRVFTLVNVFGLVFGIMSFGFISLWVWDEVRYDKFHKKADRIYQVFADINHSGEKVIRPYAPSSLVEPISDRLPEVSEITRVFPAQVVFETGNDKYSETGIYADSAFLQIFSFPLKEGNLTGLFANANSVVVSAQLAEKYFPGESALGKQIEIVENEKSIYTITGVLNDIPANSSLQFDFILSYDEFEERFRPWWGKSNKASYSNYNVTVYLTLEEGVDALKFDKKLNAFIVNNFDDQSDDELFIYPFVEVYLHANFNDNREPTGKILYVKLLFSIALFILLIACINFINLSTAIAGKRAKEVGLRKVAGAQKRQVITQFLVESTIISLISLLIALMLVEISLPIFNSFTNKFISVPFDSTSFIAMLLGGGIVLGILSGSYPAFILSTFEPIKSLKTSSSFVTSGKGIRNGLVIVQFSLSIIFIVFSLVVKQQLSYIKSKDLGIRDENIIQHPLNGIKRNKESYKQELLRIPGVQSVSFSEQDPYSLNNSNTGVSWIGKPNEDIFFNVIQVDKEFLKTFDLQILQGKDFSLNELPDVGEFILNESAAKAMMIDDPIGMEITVWGHKGKVIGIVRDYNHQSLAQLIEPVIIVANPEATWNAYIAFSTEDVENLLQSIQTVYAKYEQHYVFDFSFADDRFESVYRDVIVIGRLSSIFTVVAGLISCLGLFGLSAFVSQQKTKEIGIRKVMGANIASLLLLFSTTYIKDILISLLVAIPIAWYFASDWLANYSFHIQLGAWPFVIAGITAVLIAVFTVMYNTLIASLANPIDSLKEE